MPDTIKSYLETVQEQIRWKRARPVLIRELERHLEDQRDDFLKEGKADAERLAIEDMGDPVTVGMELDAVHRPKPQWGLLALTVGLALAGAFLRVSVYPGYIQNEEPLKVRTLMSLILGTSALLGMYFFDVSRLARHARAVYIAALAAGMLLLLLSPRYIRLGDYYNQYVVQVYPVAYAFWLYSFHGKRWKGFLLAIIGGIPLAVICAITPTMMGLILLLFSGFAVTLCAVWQDWFGVGRTKGVCTVLAITLGIAAFVLHEYLPSPYAQKRLSIAFHPELDPLCYGWRGTQLHTLLRGIPFYSYTGDPLSPIGLSHDYLPASVAVRWGWLPFLLLLLALTVLLAWMLVKGLRQRYLLGQFVTLSTTLSLMLQTLFSVMCNLGFILFSAGMPLIVGNLQTVIDMALIGLALSAFRGEAIGRDEPAAPFRQRKRLRIYVEFQ